MKLAAVRPISCMTAALLRGVRPGDLEAIEKITRAFFPTVEQISTSDLENLLRDGDRLALVDVRSAAEFAVSHLQGAFNADSVEAIERCRSGPETTLVLYCSVGFRSANLAARMQKHGIGNVLNLEGSIFRWANEGRPLYNDEGPTVSVHPFGRLWAGLLKTS